MLQILDPPNPYDIHFSRDLPDLHIQSDTENVSVSLGISEGRSATLYFRAIDGYILLRIKDILEGALPLDGQIHTVTITATADTDTALRGGENRVEWADTEDYFLSVRPHIWKSYPSFPFPRIPILLTDGKSSDAPIILTIYPVNLPAATISLEVSRDFSNQTLSELFLPQEIIDDYPYGLRAYDFVLGQKTLRTIVMKDDARVRMFYFRNTFGQLEEIYATGASKRDAGGAEYKTHTSRDVEYETGNDFKEKFITDTGDIGSQALVDYWTGFFQSSEHYIWQDGQRVRIIIDEVSSGESTAGQIASFTFSWHLAEQPTGRIVTYGPLEPYQYEVPEL